MRTAPPRPSASAGAPTNAQIAASNQTLNAFLGAGTKSWMQGEGVTAPSPRSRRQGHSLHDKQRNLSKSAPAPSKAHLSPTTDRPVLPSPALSNEPSPPISTRHASPNAVPAGAQITIPEPSMYNAAYFEPVSEPCANSQPCATVPIPAQSCAPRQPCANTQTPLSTVLSVGTAAGHHPHRPGKTPGVQDDGSSSNKRTRNADGLDPTSSPEPHKRNRIAQVTQDESVLPADEQGSPMNIYAQVLEQRIKSLGGLSRLGSAIEQPRYRFLQDACCQNDGFSVVLHQLFCCWTLERPFRYKILSPIAPETVDSAFGILSHILRQNTTMDVAELSWFGAFPIPLQENLASFHRTHILSVRRFLVSLVELWAPLFNSLRERLYPFTAHELIHTLACESPVLRLILFRFSRRHLAVHDKVSYELNKMFARDESIEINTATGRTRELAYSRNEIAVRYRALVNQARRRATELGLNRDSPSSASFPAPSRNRSSQSQSASSKESAQPLPAPETHTQDNLLAQGGSNHSQPGATTQPAQTTPASIGYNHQNAMQDGNDQIQPAVRTQASQPLLAPTSDTYHNPPVSNRSSQSQPFVETQPTQFPPAPAAYAQQCAPDLASRTSFTGPNYSWSHVSRAQISVDSQMPGPQMMSQSLSNNSGNFQQISVLQNQASPALQTHQSHQVHQDRMAQAGTVRGQFSAVHSAQAGVPSQSMSNRAHHFSLYSPNTGTHPIAAAHQAQSQPAGFGTQVNPVQGHFLHPGLPSLASQTIQQNNTHGPTTGHPNAAVFSQTPVRHTSGRTGPHAGPQQPVRVIRENEYPTGPHDWTSVEVAAHLPQLRSPKRKPVPGVSGRYYQFVTKHAVGPTRVDPKNGIRTLEFRLSSDGLARLPRKAVGPTGLPVRQYFEGCYRYRLRCCLVSKQTTGLAAADWAVSETSWPSEIYTFINDKPLEVPRKQHFHRDLPIELTDSLVEGLNTIKISLPGNRCNLRENSTFFLAVEVVTTSSFGFLKDGIENASHIEPQVTKLEIARRLKPAESDDIIVEDNSLSISVADPFSSAMFEVPVRGLACKHLECFDLKNWLISRPRKSRRGEPCTADCWKCPICGNDARPHRLRIDDYFVQVRASLLASGKDKTKRIQAAPNGDWTAVEESPDDSDDEGDQQQDQPAQHASRTSSRSIPPGAVVEILDD